MGFPDIHGFPECYPGAYERQMGQGIAGLIRLFHGCVPDPESHARVLELATTPNRWSAGHALFDQIRGRLLAAMERKDQVLCAQYSFEESCLQALYNAAGPLDPFDASSPYWVAGSAFGLARSVGVSEKAILAVFAPGADM
jgi:hypothetical protein